ncbi:hypothetical protein [Halomontanus rarus]|uniref:hypothetical protein n=1 Tax=Halomontanus rarus TaxID=3034020 RepID=UPI001A985EAC
MNTLEVTDEQYAFIQQLRERISADVVGKYGYVRERDAIQFLIDNLDGDIEVDAEIEVDSAAGKDVAASVDAALAETDSGEGEGEGDAITFDESEDALGGEDGSGDGEEAQEEADEDGSDDLEDDADESADGEADETDDADAEDEDGDEAAESDGAASDDDMLDQMMNLLDTHDDKWEESPSGDYRYRVELPDGGTEDVQTKDDVRAILFKNYR